MELKFAYHVTNSNNLEEIISSGLIPKIGPLSEMLGEKEPAIYVFPDLESLNNALLNWYGEAIEDLHEDRESVELSIIELDISGIPFLDETGYEYVFFDPIPPTKIQRVLDENLNEIIVINSSKSAKKPSVY